jgi:type III pantothenate kinase
MNIIIDQGNTLCKIGFFDPADNLVHAQACENPTTDLLEELLSLYQPEYGIFSSVKNPDEALVDWLQMRLERLLRLDSNTPLPIRNGYATPETLGLDRLAAAVGAWSLHPGKPLLVIDMGTAITYDFVSAEGVFTGGNIAPGLQTRLKSLNHYTDRLPLVEPSTDFPLLGNDTETAIRAGVMQGIVLEVEGYHKALQAVHPDLFAFLTGGDIIYFDSKLKNGIFVHENLVLTGLNRILRYNVHL